MYRKYFAALLTLLIFSAASSVISAQEDNIGDRITDTLALEIDLFNSSEPASISLKFDIRKFLRNKNEDKYMDAILIYNFGDSINIEKEIRVKPRGNNRREVCRFPPILINIKKSKLNITSLADIDKIKFVTHCIELEANNNNVLKEYLVYKMYNLISPYSFKVRLAKVNYIDTGRDNREYTGWGFFIEPEEMLAERVEAFPLKTDFMSYKNTEAGITDIMSMFQYLIGNADYSILGRQNIKLLKLKDSDFKYPIPVPYDFDYSGFVNASYAIPGDNLGIKSVRERYFLGPCRTEERFEEINDYFFDIKDELYSLILSFEYLDDRTKRHSIDYLDQYYMQAQKNKYIQQYLLSSCRDTL